MEQQMESSITGRKRSLEVDFSDFVCERLNFDDVEAVDLQVSVVPITPRRKCVRFSKTIQVREVLHRNDYDLEVHPGTTLWWLPWEIESFRFDAHHSALWWAQANLITKSVRFSFRQTQIIPHREEYFEAGRALWWSSEEIKGFSLEYLTSTSQPDL
jgi:hypothetical protein